MKKKKSVRASAELLETRQLLSSTISFAPHVDFATGTSPVALVAADFNGDGNEDLAVADGATNKVSIFFGNGGGAFTAGPVLSLSAPPSRMIVGDFNGDGKPDIAVACTAGSGQTSTSVDVFLNTGAGTFALGQITTVETGAVPGEVVPIAAGDFNQDGHLDLAVADYSSESISILMGTGTGTFSAPINYQSDAHPTAITSADFNNDGYPDLALTSTLTDNSTGTTVTSNDLSLLLDSAGGNFSAGPNIAVSVSGIPTSVVAANLTGATTPGLVVGSSNGSATIFTNTSGSFGQSAQVSVAAGSTALAVSDFDLDGNADIVSADGGSSTSTSTNSVTVVQGAGGGQVENAQQFFTGAQPADVVVSDFNNDGKPDIATANQVAGTVSVLLNNTAIPLVATKTTVVTSGASVPAGSSVAITATITAGSASPLTNEEVPTGTVNFYDSNTLLSTVTLTSSSTSAVYSTSNLAVGTHHLRAVYSGDDAYAASSSAAVVETITPTATQGPDLIGTFVSSTLPAEVAPGETGSVRIRVTNQGNTPAIGSITNQLYLSLDTQLDSGDTLVAAHGSLARAAVHLKPGQSTILTGTITVPQNISLASYFVLVSVNATGSLAESVSTNNLVVAPTPNVVADVFGAVDGRSGVALKVADNNGTPATFRLSGPGTGTVNIGDGGVDLVLDQTTAASVITVTTTGTSDFQLNSITADSVLRTLSGPRVDVSNTVSLLGGASSIALNGLGAGAFTIGGGTIASLTFGSVSGASVTTTGGIRLLSVTGWTGGKIIAPWIGTLRSKLDFTPALQLSGSGAPGGIGLNSATIGGAIAGSTWSIPSNINRISAGSFANWTLDAAVIGSIQTRGSAMTTSITASSSIRSITITGAVDSTTRFVAAVLPKKAILGGVVVNPLTDPHFS